jgi:hypothetical protein
MRIGPLSKKVPITTSAPGFAQIASSLCAGTRHLCAVVNEQLCDLGTLRVLAERVQRRVVQVRTSGRLCADLKKVLGNRYTTYTCVH